MKILSISQIMSTLVRGSENRNMNINSIWQVERNRAAQFGPSHVAEIDAIFSRQI
jgi:hypothetical protein